MSPYVYARVVGLEIADCYYITLQLLDGGPKRTFLESKLHYSLYLYSYLFDHVLFRYCLDLPRHKLIELSFIPLTCVMHGAPVVSCKSTWSLVLDNSVSSSETYTLLATSS